MKDQQFFSVLKIMICLLAYYYIVSRLSKVNIETFGNFLIENAYVINLKNRSDRLTSFKKNFENANLDFPLKIHVATDGKNINLNDLNISNIARREIEYIEKTGHRIKHYQLTRGAVGCYISHLDLWDKIYNTGDDYALIFEDDAVIPSNFKDKLQKSIKNLNEADTEWDIFVLDALCRDCIPYYENIVKINKFFLLHSYIISRKAIEKIKRNNLLYPMEQQLDWALSQHSDILNIYTVSNGFVKQGDFKTDIQLPLKVLPGINPNIDLI